MLSIFQESLDTEDDGLSPRIRFHLEFSAHPFSSFHPTLAHFQQHGLTPDPTYSAPRHTPRHTAQNNHHTPHIPRWIFPLSAWEQLVNYGKQYVHAFQLDTSYRVIQVLQQYQQQEWITAQETEARMGSELWHQLRPFQRVAVRKAVTFQRLLIADEMGAGKTLEALATVACLREHWPVCIVCPSFMLYTWKDEIHRWLHIPTDRIFLVRSSGDLLPHKARQPTPGNPSKAPRTPRMSKKQTQDQAHDFILLSYPLAAKPELHPYLTRYPIGIFDECHYMKNRCAKRAVETFRVAERMRYTYFLSGTPGNYHADFFMLLRHVHPGLSPSFFRPTQRTTDLDTISFADRYCEPKQIFFHQRPQWVFKGYTAAHELKAILHTRMIRRRKDTILSQLPKKQRTRFILPPLSTAQQKEIQESMKKEDSAGSAEKPSPYQFMETWRLTAQHKTEGVCQFIRDFLLDDLLGQDPDTQAIIFFHHQAMREAIESLLTEQQQSFFVIDGTTPLAHRQQYQALFQTTKTFRMALLSIQAAGTGLTLTKANYVFFTELLFGPDMMLQAEDRAHRITQEKTVHIIYLLQPHTMDDGTWRLIQKKELKMSQILDPKDSHLRLPVHGQLPKPHELLSPVTDYQTPENPAPSIPLQVTYKRRKLAEIPLLPSAAASSS